MRHTCLFFSALLAFGCAKEAFDVGAEAPRSEMRQVGLARLVDDSESMPRAEAGNGKPLPSADALQRKIIYTADVELGIEDFEPIPSQVEKLAKQFDGYVANSTVTTLPHRPRSGQWTIRVPVERYHEFLTAVQGLAVPGRDEVRRVSSDSRDVSEEYYDLETRIRNKKTQEKRLLELLADATGKLEEVLSVERELARVREEIERMEGRLRVLNDLTALTTVKLSIDELGAYDPAEAPTYVNRVSRAFSSSIETLVSTAKSFSIALIFLAPWLGVLLVLLILLVILVRIRRRRKRRASQA